MIDPISATQFWMFISIGVYVIFSFAYTVSTVEVYGWDFQNEDIWDSAFLIPYRILAVVFRKRTMPVRWNRCER